MNDKTTEQESISPVLKPDWFSSRWGREDQRGNGNLMTRERADRRTLRRQEQDDLERRVHRHRNRPDRHPDGRARPSRLHVRHARRQDQHAVLQRQSPSDMWSPYGLKKLGIENAPPFFTRGVLFDVQGLKGRVLDVGEEIALADLKACLERQGVAEHTITPGDAVFVRTGHGTRWYSETRTFYDGAPGIGIECARWFSSLQVSIVGADNFAVEVVPPVDPEIFHPCHQHLIMENGIHLHEGMTFEGLIEREAWVFAYVFAPLPIVGATGSPGNPIAVL
jgi:kynurenine formamidase